jgi:hypothetical protein
VSLDAIQFGGGVSGEINLMIDQLDFRVAVFEAEVSCVCPSAERYDLFRGFRSDLHELVNE